MRLSFFRRLVANINLSRDQIWILLALVVGIVGQIFVFFVPDPLRVLAPQLPMLSPQDWPGSQIGTELFISENWPWQEKRGFRQSLYLSQDSINAHIDQQLVWYANPRENADIWNQLDPDTYNGWPILERNMDTDKPASMLACNPDLSSSPPQCWYLAYWEHWFTGVFFWRQFDEDLLIQDIRQLTDRVDQLLMSAPDEPCKGILCTGIHEVGNESR
jgi:hypothetical protein